MENVSAVERGFIAPSSLSKVKFTHGWVMLHEPFGVLYFYLCPFKNLRFRKYRWYLRLFLDAYIVSAKHSFWEV